jgi:hypothetical protein
VLLAATDLLADTDPTGFASPLGRLADIAVLVAAIITGVRALWQRRRNPPK